MNLEELNNLDIIEFKHLVHTCCGSSKWVEGMAMQLPFVNQESLFKAAGDCWYACSKNDWLEAFNHHPKIGDLASLQQKFAATAHWAAGEQSGVHHTSRDVIEALAEANRLYGEKFGFIFIVCATGKTAPDMLQLCKERLHNNPADELMIAMEEQHKITLLRLQKLLSI